MAEEKTLVLNSDYSPIQVISWKDAICLYYKGLVYIVQPYLSDGKPVKIHSPSVEFEKPAVVVARKYVDMSKKRVKLSRRNILLRDGYTCQYTGAKLPENELDIDHVLPLSRGGKNEWTNMVACSKKVNNAKSDKTPKEAGLTLIRKPRAPHWSQILLKRIEREGNPLWKSYLKELGYL